MIYRRICGSAPKALLTQDPREASVFITQKETSDKLYLLAAATGGIILSHTVLQGKGGIKLEYRPNAFRHLAAAHVGVHCSKAFLEEHPEFVKALAWAVQREGWRRLKETALDRQRSICLLAENDPQGKDLKKKAKLAFTKSKFVAFVTDKCEAEEKSFFVKGL